jgi:hypothetical protein
MAVEPCINGDGRGKRFHRIGGAAAESAAPELFVGLLQVSVRRTAQWIIENGEWIIVGCGIINFPLSIINLFRLGKFP